MKHVYLYILLITCVAVGILTFMQKRGMPPADHVHFHAGFVIYIDGKRQDYSAGQYMHVDMCSIAEKQKEHNLKQVDRVHLHDNVGDVAHIHADGVLWKELFENSSITLPSDKKLTTYRNGNRVMENILQKKIEPYESIILVYGEDIEVEPSFFITKERIEEVESKPSGCEL